MNTRTVELYTEQGSTDLLELMVIDEMNQWKVCQRHNAKGRSFCTWCHSARFISRKNKNAERYNSASDDSLQRFVVASWDKSSHRAPQLSKSRSSNRKASFPEGATFIISKVGCSGRWEEDADYRKFVQENPHVRNH